MQNSRKIWQLGYELWLKVFGEIWMKNGFPGDILATTPDSIVWKKSKYVLTFDIIPWRWSNERSWNQPWRKKTCLPRMSTHFCITGPSVRDPQVAYRVIFDRIAVYSQNVLIKKILLCLVSSWSLEPAIFRLRIFQSLWNLTAVAAALLLDFLSDFKVIFRFHRRINHGIAFNINGRLWGKLPVTGGFPSQG